MAERKLRIAASRLLNATTLCDILLSARFMGVCEAISSFSLEVLQRELNSLAGFIRIKLEHQNAIDTISPFDLARKRREDERMRHILRLINGHYDSSRKLSKRTFPRHTSAVFSNATLRNFDPRNLPALAEDNPVTGAES
jgi:hypothetical protein